MLKQPKNILRPSLMAIGRRSEKVQNQHRIKLQILNEMAYDGLQNSRISSTRSWRRRAFTHIQNSPADSINLLSKLGAHSPSILREFHLQWWDIALTSTGRLDALIRLAKYPLNVILQAPFHTFLHCKFGGRPQVLGVSPSMSSNMPVRAHSPLGASLTMSGDHFSRGHDLLWCYALPTICKRLALQHMQGLFWKLKFNPYINDGIDALHVQASMLLLFNISQNPLLLETLIFDKCSCSWISNASIFAHCSALFASNGSDRRPSFAGLLQHIKAS